VKGAPFVNASDYKNPEMDQVLDAAAIEPDPAKRRELFIKFQQIAMTDLPIFPIALPYNITIASKRLKDFQSGAEGIRDTLAGAWIDN
jgi:peptide/nickel transport system substrate-binding protein